MQKTLRALVIFAALDLISGPVFAAAQIVTIEERPNNSVRQITWSYTSATDGSVVSTTTMAYDGRLEVVVFDPGSTAPTDNYDVTLTDSAGTDLLLGFGADRDTSTTEVITSCNLAGVSGSRLTLTIANAGGAKTGTVIVQVR